MKRPVDAIMSLLWTSGIVVLLASLLWSCLPDSAETRARKSAEMRAAICQPVLNRGWPPYVPRGLSSPHRELSMLKDAAEWMNCSGRTEEAAYLERRHRELLFGNRESLNATRGCDQDMREGYRELGTLNLNPWPREQVQERISRQYDDCTGAIWGAQEADLKRKVLDELTRFGFPR